MSRREYNYDRYEVGDIFEIGNTMIEITEVYKTKHQNVQYKCRCFKCGYVWNIDKYRIKDKSKCIKCSRNIFEISDDGSYWIGKTQNNIEFWFNGSDEMVGYIKSYTWRMTSFGYFQNGKGEKLHRVVMGVTNPNIFVNHLGNNKFDNRIDKLSISDCQDNSMEKRISSRNSSGVIGLIKRRDKWVGSVRVDGIGIYTKYKDRDDALIDLLILQKHFGFRHNEHLYYLINDVIDERVDEVINNAKRQLSSNKNYQNRSKNIYKKSKCNKYYIVYDINNNKFLIDTKDKRKIESATWYATTDSRSGKTYVHGSICTNRSIKVIRLHRFLFDLLDNKYLTIYIDHLNGDSLDNRRCNLELTTVSGNAKNKYGLGYTIRRNKFRAGITINGKRITATFDTEEEAIQWYNEKKKESLKNRIIFRDKNDADIYLNNLQQEECVS